MSANTRMLVLAPFHNFFVPYQVFSFLCIWDVALSPIFRHKWLHRPSIWEKEFAVLLWNNRVKPPVLIFKSVLLAQVLNLVATQIAQIYSKWPRLVDPRRV